MKTKDLVLLSLLVGIGAVLHAVIPPILFGMKPDMLLAMMFLGIILFPKPHHVLLLSVVTGFISALTTGAPGGQIANLIDKPINEEKVIFEGKAVDAIKQFPKNINVSIVLSLAGLGIDKTTVKIIADPYLEQNVHQVDVIGEFGEASFTIKNNPLPSNPKTSYLAAMSILGTLKRINQNVRIGG